MASDLQFIKSSHGLLPYSPDAVEWFVKPPQEILKIVLDYDHDTGVLLWKSRPSWFFSKYNNCQKSRADRWNRENAGNAAMSTMSPQGYLQGNLFGNMQLAHRIIWVFVYGEWPENDIDHINGIRTDNRWVNLRGVTRRENLKNRCIPSNNTSKTMGVSWSKPCGKWRAYIQFGDKHIHLGVYSEKKDAISARRLAEMECGFHKNHGRGIT